MNNYLHSILLFIFCFFCSSLFSQENCKVIKPEIAGSYSGKCKKGLANGYGTAVGTDRYEGQFLKGLPNGEGTYTWATGESYTGEWKEGKRNGEGVYTFFYDGKDSTLYGNWMNDIYLGLKPNKPNIIYKTGIDRYTIQKNGNFRNRVLIDIYQSGMRNLGITNFMISSSGGYETKIGQSVGYDEVIFPVIIKVTYTTWNKLRTATYYVDLEFEIFEPGDWKVDLYN